ncbi:MAG: U32 family peptidase [Syntrophotaleaceae bacterium]
MMIESPDSFKKPELLVPAGDMEKLETALAYGADAVYVGLPRFGLRALAGNFTLRELVRARKITKQQGKRLYLALNAYLHPQETGEIEGFLEELRAIGPDAYIISDPGVLALAQKVDPGRELHLSTQANTTNAGAVEFWRRAGIRRVNLARELSLGEIKAIREKTEAELEVFVHGAMCVAYSGRCLLSAALAGRGANAGLCAQPCRWNYALVEETRPGQYFPLEEDERGSYIMNSRDLCLVEHLPDLIATGIDSLKIEGRMKSRYYVAAVTRVYRTALDAYCSDPRGYRFDPQWRQELEKVSHRPYDSGFLFPGERGKIHARDSLYRRSHDFVGVVLDILPDGRGIVQGRNRFYPGETLELIGPGMRQARFAVENLLAEDGRELPVMQPNATAIVVLPPGAQEGDLLRRERP